MKHFSSKKPVQRTPTPHAKHTTHRKLKRINGFTIIEVLIVLAIAGFILVIIFLVVPRLQENSRNHQRKHTVNYLAAQLREYANTNGGLYPETSADDLEFQEKFLGKGVTSIYVIEFGDLSGAHDYVPPLDTIKYEFGHWCNRYGDGDSPDDPIAGADVDKRAYVVWTQLEGNALIYCIDNHGKSSRHTEGQVYFAQTQKRW
jgi:prepilin-type N-terminal cleavage/methylation domain-containing protein